MSIYCQSAGLRHISRLLEPDVCGVTATEGAPYRLGCTILRGPMFSWTMVDDFSLGIIHSGVSLLCRKHSQRNM